jgi:hypothetical protein
MSAADDKLRDRIRKLRELTEARGCTEAEALAAAEKAAALMRDHGISISELEIEQKASKTRQAGAGVKAKLWPTIAWCTNTAIIVLASHEVAFVGRAPGPDIAVYLRQVCERAVDRAIRDFKQSRFYRRRRGLASKRAAVNAFAHGMIGRLNDRLRDIFKPSVDGAAREEAKFALDLRYPGNVSLSAPQANLRHMEAATEGWLAGGKVTLARGVGGAAARLQIGGVK